MSAKIITLILMTALLNLCAGRLVATRVGSASPQADSQAATNPFSLRPAPSSSNTAEMKADISKSYGRLPMSFERNQGQTDSEVEFLARGSGYSLFLTGREAVFSFRSKAADAVKVGAPDSQSANSKPQSSVLRMRLDGANPAPRVAGLDEMPGKSNYLTLDNSAKPVTDVPHFARVKYEAVYPIIDMIYYGNQQQLEYDFIVAPNAELSNITMS